MNFKKPSMYNDYASMLSQQLSIAFVKLHGWTGRFVPFYMTNDLMLPVTAKGISCPDNWVNKHFH